MASSSVSDSEKSARASSTSSEAIARSSGSRICNRPAGAGSLPKIFLSCSSTGSSRCESGCSTYPVDDDLAQVSHSTMKKMLDALQHHEFGRRTQRRHPALDVGGID